MFSMYLFFLVSSVLYSVSASTGAVTGRTVPHTLPTFLRPVSPSISGSSRATGATSPLRFGFYADNLTETPYATIHQADTIGDASSTYATYGIPSLLLVYNAVFMGAPNRMVLQTQWESQLKALVASAAPLFASGAVIGYNLGDELVWNCLAPSNLTLVANAVKALCPSPGCIVWYNEAAVFHTPAFHDSCSNAVTDYAIPASLDWFSTDIYHMNGVEPGWVDQWARGFYNSWILPNLTSTQSLVLVPGSFGSNVNHFPNGTYVCDKACYDVMIAHDAADYKAWASESGSRVAAVMPWNWNGCPSCNGSHWTPPHTCCMDELGTDVMPLSAAAWKTLFGANLQ
jgi:hypothetical protein